MAIVYHFDLYPANDPRDGTRLVRFTDLQDADYRQVVGVGSWQAVIRANMAEAANIDPDGEQYIRVVRDDGATEAVVGGGFDSRMAYDAATASETKQLTIGGPTTMAYLARAAMAPHSYLSEFIPGSWGGDPFDRIWRLYAQGPLAGGGKLGAMLWRVLQEATHYRSGATYTHTHKDQTHVTDAHDDDRTENALPALTLGFTQYLDSNGNAWTLTSGDFTAQVGENVLGVVHRLMQAGLYLEMDPDTFELNAWENEDHRRDRTGAAWGAAVVRLQAPTDGTVATGSYKSDVKRVRTSHIRRSTLWVGGGDDVYVKATGASPIPREGFIASDVNDAAALAQIGSTQVTAREEASDVGSVRIKLGSDPVNGYYLPFEDVRVDDLITVHTGTDNWDFTEATYPVAAVRIKLREAGDWDAFVELGGSLETAEQRQFQIATQAAHTHAWPFCDVPRTIATGIEWRVASSLPAGWHEPGFDDAAYAAAVVNADAGYYDPGSPLWIWQDAGVQGSAEHRYFRTEFTLTEIPPAVRLVAAADNGARIYLNGDLIATVGGAEEGAEDVAPYNYASAVTVEIDPALLLVGDNAISIDGWNETEATPGPAAVYARLILNPYAGTDPRAKRCDSLQTAAQTPVLDSAGNLDADNVEDALAELAEGLAAVPAPGSMWRPVMAYDPVDLHWYVVVAGDGTAVMAEG